MTLLMTTYERMSRIYEHKEPDRVPITDWFWKSTIAGFYNDGFPNDISLEDFFGIDKIIYISNDLIDTSPRFPYRIVEETDTYLIDQDSWGLTKKNFKPVSSTCQHISSCIYDRDSWEKYKHNLTPDRDRINWKYLKDNYSQWRRDGYWITVFPWFGLDVISTRMINSETVLYAMADDPEWVMDMCDTTCNLTLALLELLLDAGYNFDELHIPDDMGYRNGMLFSRQMWKDIVMPYQKRAVDWAHSKGIKFQLHSCGDIKAILPDLVDLGIDMLNPLEVKANMDLVKVKEEYGNKLALRGGFDARNWEYREKAEAEIREKLPIAMKNGGYLFACDHSVPDTVSLEDYRFIVELVKKVGTY